MRVATLTLEDFRSYGSLRLELPSGTTAFVGPNGAGKTNILEALHLVARGDSPRAHDDPEMVRWGAELARVGAEVAHADERRKVEVLLFAPQPGERRRPRRYLLDGAGKRADDVVGELTVVAFFPEDVDLLTEAPGGRRRYLDAMAGQVHRRHRIAVREYGRIVEQRNALLRAIRDGESDVVELLFWDGELCRLAAEVATGRIEAIAQMRPAFERAARHFAPDEEIAVAYQPQVSADTREARESAYRGLLEEKRDRERWQATTLVGPHREDLLVSAAERPLANFASRGQQRSAVLALKIAEAAWLTDQRGETPVFLLDDVLSELDPERREALVAALPEDGQVLVTAAMRAGLPASLAQGAAVISVPEGLA